MNYGIIYLKQEHIGGEQEILIHIQYGNGSEEDYRDKVSLLQSKLGKENILFSSSLTEEQADSLFKSIESLEGRIFTGLDRKEVYNLIDKLRQGEEK